MLFRRWRRRRKRNAAQESASAGRWGQSVPDQTEFLGAPDAGRDWKAPALVPGARYIIRLTDLKNMGTTWTLPIADELLLGRAEYCAVRFYDPSVSREQCKLKVQNGQLLALQVGGTNVTKKNDTALPAAGGALLQTGDVLKLGREMVRVDAIQPVEASMRPTAPDQDCTMAVEDSVDADLAQEELDEDRTMSF